MVIGRIEIVEENASDPSRLLPMGDVEVFVAPLLEGAIDLARSVCVAGVFKSPMEVYRVFLVYITRAQVAPSSEPPGDDFGGVVGIGDLEVAVVRVDGRCVGVAGVDYQADARRVEGECALEIGI